MSIVGFWANNPGAEERLRKMHDAGLSFGEIGYKLGCGKNSAISKCRRLGLAPRPSPIREKGSRNNRRRIVISLPHLSSLSPLLLDDPIALTSSSEERTRAPKRMLTPDQYASATVAKPVVKALPVVRQSKRRCDWLDGDKPFIRCTRKARFGKSYCLAHHKIAYRRVRDLRDEAA
jgi:hypothetical protein